MYYYEMVNAIAGVKGWLQSQLKKTETYYFEKVKGDIHDY